MYTLKFEMLFNKISNRNTENDKQDVFRNDNCFIDLLSCEICRS